MAQKLLRSQVQVRGQPNFQRTALTRVAALTSRLERDTILGQNSIVDLTDDEEPSLTTNVKCETSSSLHEEMAPRNNIQECPKFTAPIVATQAFIKLEVSPSTIREETFGLTHASPNDCDSSGAQNLATLAPTPPVIVIRGLDQQGAVDLTYDETTVVTGLKHARPSTSYGEVTLASNEQSSRQCQKSSLRREGSPQLLSERESSPPIMRKGIIPSQHISQQQHNPARPTLSAVQERSTNISRANQAHTFEHKNLSYHAYPQIAVSHPTVVNLPNQEGAVELRCDLCGGNAQMGKRAYYSGAVGFMAHFSNAHRALRGDKERYTLESVIMRGGLAKDKKEKKKIREGCESVIEGLILQKGATGEDDEDEEGLTSGGDFE